MIHSVHVRGVLIPTLTPFNENGKILLNSITDQARRLINIDGIDGIAVNTDIRERQALNARERLVVIRQTRKALDLGQLVLACVGALSIYVEDEVAACRDAGADAVIAYLTHWRPGLDAQDAESHVSQLTELVERLSLPMIAAVGGCNILARCNCKEIAAIARNTMKLVGVAMGHDDNVLRYDQNYYTLKGTDRPMALLPSSEGALFHNLNTGSDGALSSLAYIAPHEVAALYRASRHGRFHEAQAIHNQLAPLIGIMNGHDTDTREKLCRQAAHLRGLLASPDARGLTQPLCPHLAAGLQSTLDDIALKPISWV